MLLGEPSPDLFWEVRGQANSSARMVFSQKVNWFILYQSADKMASISLRIGNNQEAGREIRPARQTAGKLRRTSGGLNLPHGRRTLLRPDIRPATQKAGKHRDYGGPSACQFQESTPRGQAGRWALGLSIQGNSPRGPLPTACRGRQARRWTRLGRRRGEVSICKST